MEEKVLTYHEFLNIYDDISLLICSSRTLLLTEDVLLHGKSNIILPKGSKCKINYFDSTSNLHCSLGDYKFELVPEVSSFAVFNNDGSVLFANNVSLSDIVKYSECIKNEKESTISPMEKRKIRIK